VYKTVTTPFGWDRNSIGQTSFCFFNIPAETPRTVPVGSSFLGIVMVAAVPSRRGCRVGRRTSQVEARRLRLRLRLGRLESIDPSFLKKSPTGPAFTEGPLQHRAGITSNNKGSYGLSFSLPRDVFVGLRVRRRRRSHGGMPPPDSDPFTDAELRKSVSCQDILFVRTDRRLKNNERSQLFMPCTTNAFRRRDVRQHPLTFLTTIS